MFLANVIIGVRRDVRHRHRSNGCRHCCGCHPNSLRCCGIRLGYRCCSSADSRAECCCGDGCHSFPSRCWSECRHCCCCPNCRECMSRDVRHCLSLFPHFRHYCCWMCRCPHDWDECRPMCVRVCNFAGCLMCLFHRDSIHRCQLGRYLRLHVPPGAYLRRCDTGGSSSHDRHSWDDVDGVDNRGCNSGDGDDGRVSNRSSIHNNKESTSSTNNTMGYAIRNRSNTGASCSNNSSRSNTMATMRWQ